MVLGEKTCCKHTSAMYSKFVGSSEDLIVLGKIIDRKLTFSKHIDNLCRYAQYKLHALQRNRKFTVEKTTLLDNSLIESLFGRAPSMWIFGGKICYSKIEEIRHKMLKVIYNNNQSYNSLLLQNNSAPILEMYSRFLMTKIYKTISRVNPESM